MEVFKKMWWVRLRLRCKFQVSRVVWQERRCERQLHVLANELVEGVSAVLQVHRVGLCMSGLLECEAIDILRRESVSLDKPFSKKTHQDFSCTRDALHFAIHFLPPFSQQWFAAK
jgi:hypothetical protein